MDKWLFYGPCAAFVITSLINLKIFARSEDLSKLKAELMAYTSEHFVNRETYSDNHKALQDQMLQIHQDVSDVKNILISIVNAHSSRN